MPRRCDGDGRLGRRRLRTTGRLRPPLWRSFSPRTLRGRAVIVGAPALRSLLEDTRPVELNVRIRFLDQPDRVLVDCAAADADGRGRAEVIKDSLPFRAAAPRLQNRRALVAPPVFDEAQVRQKLFPLLLRG